MKTNTGKAVREWLMITFGTVLIAAGVYFFKFPNHFSTGGVSGMSVILAHYIPAISPGSFVLIMNAALLLAGFLIFGRSFGLRTAYSSLLMSAVISALEKTVPLETPMTSQPLLELIFAVSLPAVGSAILFNLDTSSGGTDIAAMVMRKYTSLDIGKALLCSDCVITLAACAAFGMETGLFSVLGLVIKSLLVDMVLENIHTNKCFQIITSDPIPIEKYITETLHRGATELSGTGVYTHKDKTILLTVVNRREGIQLRRFARETDPYCFILITNTGEIIGKGFRGTN